MASPELGVKQVCPNCQTKFYDLNRRPAVCPKCGQAFDPEEAVRSRRVRARTAAPDYESDEEAPVKERDEDAEGFEDEAEETPEIDEAAEAEPADVEEGEDADPNATPAEPDLGVDFETETADDLAEEEEGEDVPFLEEEDEGFPEDEIEGLPDDKDEH